MGSKHTPAPWKIDCNSIVDERFYCICDMGKPILDRGAIAGENEIQQIKANARLIAAAPELLETLEAYQKIVPALRDVPDLIAQEIAKTYAEAEAAIKKAKGE